MVASQKLAKEKVKMLSVCIRTKAQSALYTRTHTQSCEQPTEDHYECVKLPPWFSLINCKALSKTHSLYNAQKPSTLGAG